MFETFEVRNCYIASQAVLCLYAYGRSTGLVIDSGYGVSNTVPVYEGNSVINAIGKIEIAGRVLTEWLQKLLLDHAGQSFNSAEMLFVKGIKEEICYVA